MLIVLRNDEIYLFMCFSIYTDISLVINFGSNIDVNFLFWKSIFSEKPSDFFLLYEEKFSLK